MVYETYCVTDGVYVFALWDDTWNSFNNCYLLKRGGDAIMIDCGKEEHKELLRKALFHLGVAPEEITVFVATHGHHDHIGASELFVHAKKWIHAGDKARLPETVRSTFQELTSGTTEVGGLLVTHLGHHTDGSVALYDPKSRCLFCGDHICFFGDPAPADGFVTDGGELRRKVKNFVSDWANNAEDRTKYRFDLFIDGLDKLSAFEARFLATGHGPVLDGQIQEFLREVAAMATECNDTV